MESILTSIKKMLGISEEYEHFDADITMHINSVLMTLTQIGVGSPDGFAISDKSATWKEFIPEDQLIEAVKSYTYLKVRLLFDPPSSSTIIESFNKQAAEYEWRINALVEGGPMASGGSGIDYEKLKNLPSINGETLIGNYDEKDPTVKTMDADDIDSIWNEAFKE